MGKHQFSTEFSPLLLSCIHGKPDIESIQTHWHSIEGFLERGEQLATIHDLALASIPSAEFREAEIDWVNRNHDAIEKYMIGSAMIVPNPVIRLALNLVISRTTLPMPYKFVSTVEEATSWIIAKMESARVLTPDRERCNAALYAARQES